MNVTDGKFYTKTSGGSVKEVGGAGSVTLQDVTTNGATTTNDILLDQGANLVFEGNLANAFETTLTVENLLLIEQLHYLINQVFLQWTVTL